MVDLQLLEALSVDDPLADTEVACRAVFEARGKHAWPPVLTVEKRNWDVIYVRALEGSKTLGLR